MNDGTWHETENKETPDDDFPEIKIEKPYDSGNEKDLKCAECEQRSDEVQWAIIVRRKYKSCFGKVHKPYCTGCVIDALTGYHTGGGLTDRVIQKIYRIRNVSAFVDEEEREKKHKQLKKKIKKRKKEQKKRNK